MTDITKLPLHRATTKKRKQPTLAEMKMKWVLEAVTRNNGNIVRAAKDLGVDRHTVSRWFSRYCALGNAGVKEGCQTPQSIEE